MRKNVKVKEVRKLRKWVKELIVMFGIFVIEVSLFCGVMFIETPEIRLLLLGAVLASGIGYATIMDYIEGNEE